MLSFGAFFSAALGIVVVLFLAAGASYSLIRVAKELRAAAIERHGEHFEGQPAQSTPAPMPDVSPRPTRSPENHHAPNPEQDLEPGVPVIFR